jgi:hypothetical protein
MSEIACEGRGERRRPLYGAQNYFGRGGERFGWGREGRVRLDSSPVYHRRRGTMGGLVGGLGGLNLGGGESGGSGGLLGGMGGMGDFDRLGNRRSPFLGRELDAGFMYHCDNPYLCHGMGFGGLRSCDRLGGGRPVLPGGIGLDLGGSRSPSLRGSNYSLDHLDRRPRPYHYQPPYVEDWESIHEEELLRPEMMEMLEQRNDIIQGADLYGLPGGHDIEGFMGRVGGRRGLL